MSKRFWVALEHFDRDLATAAIEAGAEALVVPEGVSEQVHGLGRITTIAADGDWRWGRPGIRAQLLHVEENRLEMDFRVEGDDRSLHVLNAISPAFTCSFPFAEFLLDRVESLVGDGKPAAVTPGEQWQR